MKTTYFILMVIAVSAAFVGATYILHRVFKGSNVKYTPSIILLIMALYNLFLIISSKNEYNVIAYIFVFIMFLLGSLSGIVTGILLNKKDSKMTK